MKPAPSFRSSRLSSTLAESDTVQPSVSPGSFAGLIAGRPCDPRAFQRVYPDRWRAFLRSHFRSSTEVAAFFSVDEKTARQWLEGVTGPRGWAVSFAVMAVPTAAAFLAVAA
ncbi:MAG: hypothetical protein M0R03_23120 [Novosphingobium sp.]|nr:hypothetical protein [Novosphingobium sp.]